MVTEDEKKIVILRLESMPYNMKLAVGDSGPFSREELIELVRKNDEIGEIVAKAHMNQLRSYKNIAEVAACER